MTTNFENLRAHILSLSQAATFDAAKREWRLTGFSLHEEFDSCPCGKAIKELCHIDNTVTGQSTYVGNVCIKRFIGIDTGNTFSGLKRIVKDEYANANEDLIRHAYKFGYIYEKEYGFLMQTTRKRLLSEKQLTWKQKINHRIVNRTVVRRPTKGT